MGAYENQNVVGSGEILIPNIATLYQNYPNPFNPETTISFSVTQTSSFVALDIYNIKGQKVKTLVNEMLPAGEHTIIWDGRDSNDKRVGSGIYFYKLKTENYEKTRKMILLK
jgi:flagellar hook assembly protein FlgD